MGAQRSKEPLFSSIPLGEARAALPRVFQAGSDQPPDLLQADVPSTSCHSFLHWMARRAGGRRADTVRGIGDWVGYLGRSLLHSKLPL